MPNIRWLLALITRIHRFAYVRSGGVLGHRALHMRFLLLEHVGRRTGLTRRTPLLYVEEGGRYVVIASNAGDERPPAWWLNLRERPETTAWLGRERIAVKAREADAAERDRLWTRLQESYAWYDDYQRRTARRIPVVLLEPAG